MTTFALVHGAWHDASCWEELIPLLERAGHRAIAPDLPIEDVRAGFEDYARIVEDALAGVDDPVLVGHSLASDTIALVGVARSARLVYLCPRLGGFDRPEGEPVVWEAGFRGSLPDDEDRTFWPAEAALRVLYPRVEQALAERMAARLRPQVQVWRRPYPLSVPPPGRVVLALQDECFRPEWTRWAARTLVGVEPVELPGGHFPMLERPAELAELLCG